VRRSIWSFFHSINSRRVKLLSERFTLGTDASAAWGNGKTAHEDPSVKIVVYGQTKGVFAGFGLDGATFKPDDSGNKSLYGQTVTNHDIVENEFVRTLRRQPSNGRASAPVKKRSS